MSFIFEWVSLCIVWMLFVGKWRAPEFCVGVVAALVAATASRTVRKNAAFHFRLSRKDIAQGWRLPGEIISGTWKIFQVLAWRLLSGRRAAENLRAVGFSVGKNDPSSRGRRALAVGFTSGTPNSVVLGIDSKNHLLIFHQLKKSEISTMTRKLGAKAR